MHSRPAPPPPPSSEHGPDPESDYQGGLNALAAKLAALPEKVLGHCLCGREKDHPTDHRCGVPTLPARLAAAAATNLASVPPELAAEIHGLVDLIDPYVRRSPPPTAIPKLLSDLADLLDSDTDDHRLVGVLQDLRELTPFPPAENLRHLGPPFLIPFLLPARRLTLLTGRPGIGKSSLAVAIAAGAVPSYANHAIVASYEDDPADLYDRRQDPTWRDVVNLGRTAPLWTDGPSWTAHALRVTCRSRGADLLFLDPLAACYAADENDRGQVRQFCRFLDQWAQDDGVAIVLMAHPSKSPGSEWSGSTDWQAAVRTHLELRRIDHGRQDAGRVLRVVKSNLATAGAVATFTPPPRMQPLSSVA